MRPLLAFTAALLISAPAYADTIYTGTFSGDQETVDTGSPGTGDGRVILSDDGLSLTVELDFTGLLSPTVDSHIHCCAPLGEDPLVNNAPVAVGFTPAGFPLGVTEGPSPQPSISRSRPRTTPPSSRSTAGPSRARGRCCSPASMPGSPISTSTPSNSAPAR